MRAVIELTVFVVLVSPELIVHHDVLQLRILMVGSYPDHFFGLGIFFHLDQLFLVDIVGAIKGICAN